MKQLLFIVTTFIFTSGFIWPFHLFSHPNPEPFGTQVWIDKQIEIIESESSVNPTVLRYSLIAYINAHARGFDHKQILTVVDFSQPSTAKRLWVFDLHNGHTLFNTWVSHGKNSGGVNATSFSNENRSLKSSIGVFVTDHPYTGHNGYSLRLTGLEPGFNDHAYRRAIVFHGAPYVNAATISRYGQIGHSWGCFAVPQNLIGSVVRHIKANTVVVAYYPDRNWLTHSQFLSA